MWFHVVFGPLFLEFRHIPDILRNSGCPTLGKSQESLEFTKKQRYLPHYSVKLVKTNEETVMFQAIIPSFRNKAAGSSLISSRISQECAKKCINVAYSGIKTPKTAKSYGKTIRDSDTFEFVKPLGACLCKSGVSASFAVSGRFWHFYNVFGRIKVRTSQKADAIPNQDSVKTALILRSGEESKLRSQDARNLRNYQFPGIRGREYVRNPGNREYP